ncbi:FadR/GntR family transcriptional regulator [Microbacterium sp. gxy059]|uniref:FadR/GntR family transcriptional regulator n=1 Tax=Microbacterium sp. gxy059 TaxID=2957199 RepID=UPI003D97B5AA
MSDKMDIENPAEQPLFHRVVEVVRRRGLRAGDPMPSEAQLCRELDAGRQQVREALSALEALGIVVSRQGARRIWKGFDMASFLRRSISLLDDAHEGAKGLLEVRHALETSMLPAAAPRLARADLDALRALAREMVARAERGESFAELDERFHRGLLAPLQNPALDAILQSFWAAFAAALPDDESVAENPEIAAMHERVIDAIEEGDMRRAVYELDAHFYGVRNRFPDVTFGAASVLAV